MPEKPLAFRNLTLVAAGFLALDGAGLAGVGLRSGRRGLVLAGAGLLTAAVLVLLYWRRHLRRLEEIAVAQRDLHDEAGELRRILRG